METTMTDERRKELEDIKDGLQEILKKAETVELSKKAQEALNFVDDLHAVTRALLSLDQTVAKLMIQIKGDPNIRMMRLKEL